jgi:hypothetical protein
MSEVRAVEGLVNYIGPMDERPRFYANDHSKDVLNLEPHKVRIEDARTRKAAPTLDGEGFALVDHRSAIADFRNGEEVAARHPAEIEQLLLELTGADRVVVNGAGLLRFSERLKEAGKSNNSWPARFIHIDSSDETARQFAERSRPKDVERPLRRYAHFNVWRAFSEPPQDIPLAVCAADSLEMSDMVPADAIFDHYGQPEWSFEAFLVRYSPRHRWSYFSNMTRDEALVFKTKDSDPERAHHVPHTGFDDPSAPAEAPPRISLEMRACAYWFA